MTLSQVGCLMTSVLLFLEAIYGHHIYGIPSVCLEFITCYKLPFPALPSVIAPNVTLLLI